MIHNHMVLLFNIPATLGCQRDADRDVYVRLPRIHQQLMFRYSHARLSIIR